MNIKKVGPTLIVGALLLGGAGSAFGISTSTSPPPPPPKPIELGPQAGAQHTAIPASFGTKNVVTKREYTELAVPCRLYDSRATTPLQSGSFRTS